ncbi:hypothetical protein GCM10029978_068580 [Actinoallomurus acanthiterrae]
MHEYVLYLTPPNGTTTEACEARHGPHIRYKPTQLTGSRPRITLPPTPPAFGPNKHTPDHDSDTRIPWATGAYGVKDADGQVIPRASDPASASPSSHPTWQYAPDAGIALIIFVCGPSVTSLSPNMLQLRGQERT